MPAKMIPSSIPVGTKFGRLTTIALPHRTRFDYGWVWQVDCRCSCGKTKCCSLDKVKTGAVVSCGCWRAERARERCIASKHVPARDIRLRNLWRAMKARCCDPTHVFFHRYGGRGIKICNQWMESFDAFRDWAVSHPSYRDGLSIERVDNDGNYCPENCVWIPRREQSFNTSTTQYFEFQGERKRLAQWMEDPRCLTPCLDTFYGRLKRGWSFEEALTTPATRAGSGGKPKLTQALADEIREVCGRPGVIKDEVAKTYGISQSALHNILTGRSWADTSMPLRTPRVRVTEDQVRGIRADRGAGMLHREIAAKYGIATNTVTNIVNRKAWANIA